MQTRIDEQLEESRIALTNALGEEGLLGILAQFGYGAERLQEGLDLYTTAQRHVQQQVDARRAQVAATDAFTQAWNQAKRVYHHDLRAARLALQDRPEAQHNLQLSGTREPAFPAWLRQAQQFYAGLLDEPTLGEAVAILGVTPERLATGQKLIYAAQSARSTQRQLQGTSRKALRERNAVLQQLRKWMQAFTGVAKIALADMPDQLMTLGLTSPVRRRNSSAMEGEVVEGDAPILAGSPSTAMH